MILLFLQYGPLAQLVARLVRIEEVRSSNLLGSTNSKGRSLRHKAKWAAFRAEGAELLVSDVHQQVAR